MRQHTIDMVVPADMADILINEAHARTTFGRRSTTLKILAEAASVTSITISLLQGPATVMQVARAIKKWTHDHRKTNPRSDALTVETHGKEGGRTVDADTDIEVIIEILQIAMNTEGDPQPPEGIDGLTI